MAYAIQTLRRGERTVSNLHTFFRVREPRPIIIIIVIINVVIIVILFTVTQAYILK